MVGALSALVCPGSFLKIGSFAFIISQYKQVNIPTIYSDDCVCALCSVDLCFASTTQNGFEGEGHLHSTFRHLQNIVLPPPSLAMSQTS